MNLLQEILDLVLAPLTHPDVIGKSGIKQSFYDPALKTNFVAPHSKLIVSNEDLYRLKEQVKKALIRRPTVLEGEAVSYEEGHYDLRLDEGQGHLFSQLGIWLSEHLGKRIRVTLEVL